MFFTKSAQEMLKEMDEISKAMDQIVNAPLWESKFFTYSPNFDQVSENEVELALPGFTKDEINIEVDGSIMTISAKVENESKYRKSFVKTYSLGDSIDPKKITATMENGILLVKFEKKDTSKKVTKIEIK